MGECRPYFRSCTRTNKQSLNDAFLKKYILNRSCQDLRIPNILIVENKVLREDAEENIKIKD